MKIENKYTLEQDDINKGHPCLAFSCPLAKMFKRYHPKTMPEVSKDGVSFYPHHTWTEHIDIEFDTELRQIVDAFDKGTASLLPITIEVKRIKRRVNIATDKDIEVYIASVKERRTYTYTKKERHEG